MSFQSAVLALLDASLVRPIVLIGAAWLVLRVCRVRHPASRHAVWTAVLAGMLVLPVLSVAMPDWTLRILPWAEPADGPIASLTNANLIEEHTAMNATPTSVVPGVDTSQIQPVPFLLPSLASVIAWGYVAGLLAMLCYRLIGWQLLRRVVSRSKPLRPSCLRESDDVVTPIAVGFLRPSVILPTGWRGWSARTKRAVLAHEFAHLRRRDTLVAALARLVKCVFWFHPAAWWVCRQTTDLAELACDAVALQRVGDPADYSRVLVEFAGAVSRSGQRVALPGLAMASASRMGKRVDHVFELSEGTMRKLSRPGVWLLTIGLPVLTAGASVELSGSTRVEPQVAQGPSFDAVSIRPCLNPWGSANNSGRGAAPWSAQTSPGYLRWDCISLYELIHQAYARMDNPLLNNRVIGPSQGDPWLVQGGSEWIMKDRYTVEVRVSGEAPRSDLTGGALHRFRMDEMAPAIRAMLEDRFQLKLRRVMGERPMYALTVARSGLKIKPAVPGDCWDYPPNPDGTIPTGSGRGGVIPPPKPADAGDKPRCGPRTGADRAEPGTFSFHGASITFADLAAFLSPRMDRWVLDKTGIDTKFTFEMRFVLDDHFLGRGSGGRSLALQNRPAGRALPPPPPPPAGGKTIFEALAGIGLHLVRTNGPAEYFVIDRVQRPKPN